MERSSSSRRRCASSLSSSCTSTTKGTMAFSLYLLVAMTMISSGTMSCMGFRTCRTPPPSIARPFPSSSHSSISSPFFPSSASTMRDGMRYSTSIIRAAPSYPRERRTNRGGGGIGGGRRLVVPTTPATTAIVASMTARTGSMSMTSTMGEDGDGKGGRLVVRLWLSLRRAMSRIWSILLRPFRLLRSIFLPRNGDGASRTAPLPLPTSTTTSDVDALEERGGKVVAETTKMEGAAASSSTRAHDESSIAGGKGGAVAAEAATVVEAVAAAGDAAIGGAREWARTIVDATALVVDEPTWDDEPKGTAVTTSSPDRTTGRRRAATTAAVDLTGNWTLIVDDDFASNYDNYLRQLGQPVIVRTVARSVIGSTREETMQSNDGRRLFIRGTNVRGSWERTLESSEWSEDAADDVDDNGGGTYGRDHVVQGHELKPMTTADGENVEVASWWEDDGLVHHSWVVGGRKYGGGDFENRRYLTDGGNILVCESTFHPRGEVGMEGGGGGGQGKQAREEACVTWRFLREGAIYGDAAVDFPNIFDVLTKDEKDQKKDQKKEPKSLAESSATVAEKKTDVASTSTPSVEIASPLNDDSFVVNGKTSTEREERGWITPVGDRWAISSPDVDLSGKWKLIVTDKFKVEYEEFLRSLGQPLIVRGAAVVLIGNTREETRQSDGGRSLYIRGVNANGIWERTLVASGTDCDASDYEPLMVPILTADAEKVVAESWWQDMGTTHVSWTRGVKKYGGGSFESKRYLENDGKVYVCESTFHPTDGQGRDESHLKWKFLREGAAYMLSDDRTAM